VYKDNDHHPTRAKQISEEGFLMPFLNNNEKTSSNRQELSACYFLSHNFWVLNVKKLLSSSGGHYPWPFMGSNVLPYEVDTSVDIHNKQDIHLSKLWIKENEKEL
jgi:CMP-N-acetylneuraminic acid synthetase